MQRHGRGEVAAPERILNAPAALEAGIFTARPRMIHSNITRNNYLSELSVQASYFSFHLSLRTQPFVLQEHCGISAMSLTPRTRHISHALEIRIFK